jgi:amino acid transporter
MDGLLPNAFKYVSERYRTPINTIILSGIGGILFAAGIEYTTWLGVLSGALGIAFAFLFTSVAALVFPFRKRDFYKRSGVAWEVAGVPLISIVGGLNVIALLMAIYIMIVDPRAFANSPTSLTLVALFLLAGLALFYVMKYVRKRQGVDVNLIFREIPVE